MMCLYVNILSPLQHCHETVSGYGTWKEAKHTRYKMIRIHPLVSIGCGTQMGSTNEISYDVPLSFDNFSLHVVSFVFHIQDSSYLDRTAMERAANDNLEWQKARSCPRRACRLVCMSIRRIISFSRLSVYHIN